MAQVKGNTPRTSHFIFIDSVQLFTWKLALHRTGEPDAPVQTLTITVLDPLSANQTGPPPASPHKSL